MLFLDANFWSKDSPLYGEEVVGKVEFLGWSLLLRVDKLRLFLGMGVIFYLPVIGYRSQFLLLVTVDYFLFFIDFIVDLRLVSKSDLLNFWKKGGSILTFSFILFCIKTPYRYYKNEVEVIFC